MPSRLGHGLYKKIDRLKNIFHCIQYNYYLEDTKDALYYKSGRLTIGQNCSTVCSSKRGHFVCFERPAKQGTKSQVKREARFVLCHAFRQFSGIDSTFELSENVAIAYLVMRFKQLLLAWSERYGLNNSRFKFCAAFINTCPRCTIADDTV